MKTIERSEGNDWFDEGPQTFVSRQAECSIQTIKWTSDWNGEYLSKGGASSIVSDMCPYLQISIEQ